ncbi:TetR family transcriptional regulator [Bacillus oleivorans]|uniref:TetR family transcriptional regulator n=1 Tax=Bacillus oleivorans TaxID=1448271 RepID=A0A285CPC5_9BACI|nr:TetR/AcrR family transcriptional regulator [Bacillus oleivorans]SNX69402.1 TetR family transcriptional regulator [Bacillus oleivorans]
MLENTIKDIQNLSKKGLETRAKILNAAEKVFGEKGYYEASVVNITQEAEVGQGTFYNYFESKKHVYDELIQQYSRELRITIKEEMKKAITHEEAQRYGFKAFFNWVKDHPALYSIVQQAVVVDQELYRWYYNKLASGFLKSLSQGVQEGEFRETHLETVAYCLMSIGQFLGMRWVFWEGQDVPDEVFDAAMTLVFKGIKKH